MPDVSRSAPSKNHTQSVLFYKNNGWNTSNSKAWLKSHDYYSDGLDETDSLLRYRQYNTSDSFTYRTKTIETKNDKPSIALVLAFKKSGQEIEIMTDNHASRNLIDKIIQWLKCLVVEEPTEQAMSMPDIYSNVAYALNPQSEEEASGPYKRLIDCYLDGTDVYAIVAIEGKLFKTLVAIENGGVSLGEMEQVEIEFKPVKTGQSFKVIQQADGKYRWYAFPAATAVLNRNGYLNSRELYDNFKKHIEQGESPMPYLTFYHVGEDLVLGQADFVEREGYTLLISGLFNDTPLAQRLAQSKEYDGVSIGFIRDPDSMQVIQVADAVTIPVDTDGTLLEVSAMREIDAACLMTVFASKGVQQMNQETLKKLKELAGNDAAAAAQVEALADKVDQTNQAIVDENLVRQGQAAPETDIPLNPPEGGTEPVLDPPTGSQGQENAPVPEQEINLTEEAFQAIVERVRSGFAEELAVIQGMTEALNAMQTSMNTIQERLAALEQTDQGKVAQAVLDMPRNVIKVGYQPRNQQAQEKPPVSQEEETAEDVASQTLANLRTALKIQK